MGGLNLYQYALNPVIYIDPLGLMNSFDLWFTQDTISDVFSQGPWKGLSVKAAIEETIKLGHLPDGLQINYMNVILPNGQEVSATLNNRTTYVAQQAGVDVKANNVGVKGTNQYNKLTDGGSRLPTPEQPEIKVKGC